MSAQVEVDKSNDPKAMPTEAQTLGKALADSSSPAVSLSSSEIGEKGDAEKSTPPADPETSPRDIHVLKLRLAVFSVLASTFLFALVNTIVADVQPAIVERFGDVNKLPWLAVAFLVAAAGTNLVW